ncbi:hypothetical protein EDD18DRAFT_267737 [Armillaria luteobubalina]|uniref:Uncharacterized protein n=1 Tax=Armillaria luteobubalina TaxID=153913 RepID=A0AA39Q2Z0_9AGAR|nr:hypothetical protein EDD18DRAFT_267737 [Armillaria luteobubalina]
MQAIIWRPLSSIFKAHKTVAYGLSASRHVKLSVPVHRRFTTFASGSLQIRYASPVVKLSRVRVRTISYSSIPMSIVKAFRVPITVALIGAGVYWYVCYKIDELKSWALGQLLRVVKPPGIPETWLNDVQVTADKILKSVTNDIKSHIKKIKLPDISETEAGKFIEGLFGGRQHKEGDGKSEGSGGERQSDSKPSTDETVATTSEDKGSPAWLKAVEGTAKNILKSAGDGLNDIGSRIQKENLPEKVLETDAGKFIKNLFGGQQHKEGDRKSEGSEGERQPDSKPTTGETEVTTPQDKRPPAWLKAEEGTMKNILKSTNDTGSPIQKENLPDKVLETDAGKFTKNLLGGQQHEEGKSKSEGSEGEQQSDKKALTGAKSEIVDKEDRSSSAHE